MVVVPPPDFLERSLPYLAPGIGAVQARWGHLNADRSCLTRAQALALDGHFLVEQVSQARLGLFLNFNGCFFYINSSKNVFHNNHTY